MFLHNLKYTLKVLFRSRMLIFWTYAFPIIMATFFYMAFSDIENSEKLDIIDIAVVDNEAFNNNFALSQSIKVLSNNDSDGRMFDTRYVTEEEAKNLLENDEITGYILCGENVSVVVNGSGINETIFKSVVEEVSQSGNVAADLMSMEIYKTSANVTDISKSNLSYTMIEFYTLIAMTCLYGGLLGVTAINQNLANMSNNGKRVSVSPIKKGGMVLSSLMAAYIVQVIGIAILFVYTIFALKVDYGNNLLMIVLLSLVGCLAGTSVGVAIAACVKGNENTKTGIIIAYTMLCCFLSGMMGITMKYIVDKNVPFINKINPANMITDGFYSLYYYDTKERFYMNIISLLVFSAVAVLISLGSLRRQKYDSI